MTDNCNEYKWNKFEASGRITDYLDYVGVSVKNFSELKEEQADADNGKGSCNSTAGCG